MEIFIFLTQTPNGLDEKTARWFAAEWRVMRVKKGQRIASQGEPDVMEHIILDGCATSQISDPEGRGVCVGFHTSPCVVTPNVARSGNGISLVSIEASVDALVAQMDNHTLIEHMLASEPVRDWANGILQQELGRKVDREWCLAALGGIDRLSWFRERYPGYEATFNHGLIASFLGVTPVTLSRLRHGSKE